MFSSKDFEKCWFLYQSEGLPYNLSIEEFCLKQGVPVNEFNKWYRDTHKRIHPIPRGVNSMVIDYKGFLNAPAVKTLMALSMRLPTKKHGSPRRGTGFVSHTKTLTQGGLPTESVTLLPYREGLGLGGCLFLTFSAPEKVKHSYDKKEKNLF